MKDVLKKLDPEVSSLVGDIGAYADSLRVSVRLIGGIVRDALLGLKSRDVDIVLEADAIDFAQGWAKVKGAVLKTHPRFGTATVYLKSGLYVDFVTARRETYPTQGALPKVEPSTFEDDVVRRDFTINALAVQISGPEYGRMIDRCGGQEDLRNRVIRIFHDESFVDDPTRVLRAVRFERRFDFRLESLTRRLLKEALSEGLDGAVSPPRYFTEFRRFFSEPDPAGCLKRLDQLGGGLLFQQFSYDAKAFSDFCRRVERLKKLQLKFENWPMIYMLGLFWGMPEKQRAACLDSFQLRRPEKGLLQQLTDLKCYLKHFNGQKDACLSEMVGRFSEDLVFFVLACGPGELKGEVKTFLVNQYKCQEL